MTRSGEDTDYCTEVESGQLRVAPTETKREEREKGKKEKIERRECCLGSRSLAKEQCSQKLQEKNQ